MGCTTSASAGFQGQVYVSIDGGATFIPVGECKSATLTITRDEIDATSFDSVGWKENITGLASWEMSMEALYINQSYRGNAGQVNVQNAMFGGQTVKWRLLPLDGVGNLGYLGDGFVNSFEIAVEVEDAVMLSLSVMGCGYLEQFQAT